MISLVASAALLLVAVFVAVRGARALIQIVNKGHTKVLNQRYAKLFAEARRLEYDAKAIHKDATDALLEVRQLQVRAEQTVILGETVTQKAETVLNDPRVQHALRSAHG